MANNSDDNDDDSFSDGSDGDEVPRDIEHGFRGSRWSTTFFDIQRHNAGLWMPSNDQQGNAMMPMNLHLKINAMKALHRIWSSINHVKII